MSKIPSILLNKRRKSRLSFGESTKDQITCFGEMMETGRETKSGDWRAVMMMILQLHLVFRLEKRVEVGIEEGGGDGRLRCLLKLIC